MRPSVQNTIRFALALTLLALLAACGSASQPPASSQSAPAGPVAAQQQQPQQPSSSNKDVPAIGGGPNAVATPAKPQADVKLLKVSPDKGNIGDSFTISGEGLPAGKTLEFMWVTAQGKYSMVATAENVEFHAKKFDDKRISLGKAAVDASGKVNATLKVPEDYGEVHDIFAVLDGQDIARGGFRAMRNITMNPTSGPLGTPITFKVTGLGWKTYESTLLIRYDNNQTGMVTAVTTNGTAVFKLRAAGKTGTHVIDVDLGARSIAFLNNQQSGTASIADQRFEFTVTDDKVVPPFMLDWPDDSRVVGNDAAARTTVANKSTATAAAVMEPATGPILSQPTLRARGLTPDTDVEIFWVTARGNRVSPSGWSLDENSIAKAKVNADGTLATAIQIPDDLGGWHSVKLVSGDKVVAEAPYFVERSLVDVTPRKVRAGEIFTVHLKGVGWTELDNGVALTYDNSYLGFACGFNSNGDVTINLTATGGAGIHLIDLYPMLYQGHGEPPWSYQIPFLTFAQDFPGLQLGYKLPAFRLAIEVVE